jgi:hypothetical protein
MKTIKVELTIENDDGSQTIKTLTGADATQWQRWVDDVCVLAWTHRHNPDWGSLSWTERKEESVQEVNDEC